MKKIKCRIADLIVEIPIAGGMASRCGNYLCNENELINIIINYDNYNKDKWKNLNEENMVYMESGYQFYLQLLCYDGIYIHSSAVELDGKAYLFSGPCGTGKSTHTKQWQKAFGERAQIFNDDKPALRKVEGKWYAYGTPWCGKEGINQNKKIPLAGICFLKKSEENRIARLSEKEAIQNIISQTIHRLENSELLSLMINHVESLVQEIPIYLLENRPEPEAACLSYETMKRGAEEMNL